MKKILFIILAFFFFTFAAFAKVKTETINVAFTIDNNYPVMTLVTITSILDHNFSKSKYVFYIVENNITDKNKKILKDFVEKKKQKIEFIHVDTKKFDEKDNIFSFSNRITSIAMARILLPELLPASLKKVIYMDSDIVATEDLKKLYDMDLGSKSAGMVLNHSQINGAEKLYKFKHGYYNSGVILFNLDVCRKNKSSERMLTFLEKNKEKFMGKDTELSYVMKWKYPDQDLINVVWDGEIKSLPINWNLQCYRETCTLDVYHEHGLIHYVGPHKPWDYNSKYKYFLYNQIYYGFLDKPELLKYKYYFIFNRIYKNYKNLADKKIKRYKAIIGGLFLKQKKDRLFLMYYVPNKEER